MALEMSEVAGRLGFTRAFGTWRAQGVDTALMEPIGSGETRVLSISQRTLWSGRHPYASCPQTLWRTTTPSTHTPDNQGREDGSKIRTPRWLPLLPYLACPLSPNSVLRSPQPMPSQAHPRPRLWAPAPATLGTSFLNHAPPSPPAVPVTSSALFSRPCPLPPC